MYKTDESDSITFSYHQFPVQRLTQTFSQKDTWMSPIGPWWVLYGWWNFQISWNSREHKIAQAFDEKLVQTIASQSESLGRGFKFPEIQRQKCVSRMEGMQIFSQSQMWRLCKRWLQTERERAEWLRQDSGPTEREQGCETERNRVI